MRKTFSCVIVALAAATFFAFPPPSSAQETPSSSASESAADTNEATDTSSVQSNWIAKVDEFFGKYLVAPVATFAFYPVPYYDFSAGEWRPYVDPATADLPQDQQVLIGTKLPVVVVWLVVGAIFFTIRMGFINIRGFWHAVRVVKGDYDDPNDVGEVSHFQALSSALSATVGLGNIGGVAIAVGTGGPGALVWMLVAGVLGMSSKFVECTLAQSYRHVDPDGQVSGGPMRYLADGLREKGLGALGKCLAVMFSIFCILASFGGGCAFQVDQSLGAIKTKLPWLDGNEFVYGLVMAVAVGVVIIGGIRRIAATAEKIVPLMCGIYILISLYILFVNFDRIPWAIEEIFRTAFQADAAKGGILGVLVIGFKRAAFSNEAGTGSAAIAHAAAKTEEPVREGAVASLGPFIDTVVVCMMTGLVIVITQVYDPAKHPDLQKYVIGDNGAALTSEAMKLQVWWFPYVLAVAVVLFAYSTMISWSYYGERCATSLLGRWASLPYKIVFLVFVFLGAIVSAKNVLDFSDLMILTMAFPNVLGVALLSGKVRKDLDDYWRRYKAGEFKKHK
ncbi:Amino-acid carrier protein AlsT [Symmachiella macrocystis]|uniref:Amino-acid carrier protein AlsT n=1 Tax=Symmachiella macrocystis TaxID=2527985 RepID=A0A5C6B6G3_9PLAN|nr:alanine/glycine:cation symporter family protein [Symmachiella macrocystis]TWU07132.1 Amino-acid carrier protein AlsT [Symmachiella macrocystis]